MMFLVKRIYSSNSFLSVLEQGVSSGGNFLFFFLSARILGAEGFGEFAVFWGAIQLVHGVVTQWIWLPIRACN